jgi:glycosyltransferase involved in cell wall biosynthesis
MEREAVSVLMLTRNHGPFVRQAIESVLAQRGDRPFRLWIGEDASTDGTAAICRELQAAHPDRIRLLTSPEPLGMHGNFARLWAASSGEYVAFCEGDDFWRDPRKLRKQVDYLERNADCALCGSATDVLAPEPDGAWRPVGHIRPRSRKAKLAFADLIRGYGFHFSSVTLRRRAVDFPAWFPTVYCVDRPLYLLAAQHGLAGWIPEATSVYRLHPGGLWSTLDARGKASRSTHLFETMKANFPARYGREFDRALGRILWSYLGEAVRAGDAAGLRTIYRQCCDLLPWTHFVRQARRHAGIRRRLARGCAPAVAPVAAAAAGPCAAPAVPVPEIEPNLVSTVIPVYNRAGMVGQTVRSVLAQTYRPIEILLVDDGSTDGTLAELNRLAAAHPEIVRVAHRENGGPGLARETGRRLARGEFIQYLDSDDLLLPRKFEVQVAALRAHPECGIAYGRSRLIGADGNTRKEPSKWTGRTFDHLFPALLVDRWWHTHTPLYRRSLCDEIGPWPARQPEDWDYDARAGATGVRLAFCDETVSCHRHHAGHRITDRSRESTLPQEAWFLPRLFACAVQAGVPPEAPEMRHFARWAFALARHVGALGLSAEADALLDLAVRVAGRRTFGMRMVQFSADLLGWRETGRLCGWAECRWPNRKPGPETLSSAWNP